MTDRYVCRRCGGKVDTNRIPDFRNICHECRDVFGNPGPDPCPNPETCPFVPGSDPHPITDHPVLTDGETLILEPGEAPLVLTTEDYSQTALDLPDTIPSVVSSPYNGPLLAAAATLWIKDTDEVLDLPYGRGKFWTEFRPRLFTTNDLNEQGPAQYHDDFRSTGWDAESFDVIVFDPPYISPGGRDTSTIPDFNNRYGLEGTPRTTADLIVLIASGITEAARLLNPGGRLFVKCMDYQEGSTFHTIRHSVVDAALQVGLRQVDEFVHYSGTGPQPGGRKQHVSRRAHSFLCIFRKPKRRT